MYASVSYRGLRTWGKLCFFLNDGGLTLPSLIRPLILLVYGLLFFQISVWNANTRLSPKSRYCERDLRAGGKAQFCRTCRLGEFQRWRSAVLPGHLLQRLSSRHS